MVCRFSSRKDRYEFEKYVARVMNLIELKNPSRPPKFVKNSKKRRPTLCI